MPILQEKWPSIKAWLDDALSEWGLFALIMVACFGSFALGRLSALEASKAPIRLYNGPLEASAAPLIEGGEVVAAAGGESYYYPWCAGADKIAPDRRRYFASEAAAKKAGLRPAKNCKGLQ